MNLTKLVLRFAAPTPQIETCGRFLFIGPHPDDIELGAGATAAKLAAAGKAVCFLICTDGRYGLRNAPPGTTSEELIRIRQAEALASAAVLGVHDVRFLDYSDGGFYDNEALQRSIAAVIGDFQPDVIFAPDPEVRSEGHIDHLNVGFAARRLAVAAPNDGIMRRLGAKAAPVEALAYYMTARPNRFVGTRDYLDKQFEAIFSCHVSQFPPGSPDAKTLRTYLKLRAADFALRTLRGPAEGFRVLGQTHIHCLPEAGL